MTTKEAIKEFVEQEYAVSKDTSLTITDDGLLTGDMDLVDVNTAVVTYSIFDRNGDVHVSGINAEDLYDEIVRFMEQLENRGTIAQKQTEKTGTGSRIWLPFLIITIDNQILYGII